MDWLSDNQTEPLEGPNASEDSDLDTQKGSRSAAGCSSGLGLSPWYCRLAFSGKVFLILLRTRCHGNRNVFQLKSLLDARQTISRFQFTCDCPSPQVSHALTGVSNWGLAVPQSLLYTGIMHVFDIWTQPGTRDTLNGHWLDNYFASVSSLRGWSDGDTFMAPYVAHTIEGSVFGYIQRQNDPKYRKFSGAMAAITSLASCVLLLIPRSGTPSGRSAPSAKRRLATSCCTLRRDS